MLHRKHLPTLRFILVLILLVTLHTTSSLKCRSDEGPSEAELKRVSRNCMRKVGENSSYGNGNVGGMSSTNSGTGSRSHGGSSYNGYYGQQNNHQQNSNYNYDDDNNNNNNGNNGNRNNNYQLGNNERRDRMQINRSSSSSNNERGGRGSSNSNGGRGNSQSNNNNNNNNNNGGGGSSNRSSMQNNNNGNGGNNDNNKNNNSSYDGACVVHCFFEEMNMLNNDDYPDKHKVNYMLTKDIRDRDLRNFYSDTIQDCFRYLETQRRRDKCHFSRELIDCMTEYAKANCDDWQEYNMMFN